MSEVCECEKESFSTVQCNWLKSIAIEIERTNRPIDCFFNRYPSIKISISKSTVAFSFFFFIIKSSTRETLKNKNVLSISINVD